MTIKSTLRGLFPTASKSGINNLNKILDPCCGPCNPCGGGSFVEGTYASVRALQTSNSLKPGTWYSVSDYAAKYYRPDYDSTGARKPNLTFVTEASETLLLLATSENTFDINARSIDFPKDKIQYDITITSAFNYGTEPAQTIKGRIIERIDEFGNRTDYDHRVVKFIRYNDGSGTYNSWKDTGEGSNLFTTFNFTAPSIDNYIGNIYIYNNLTGFEFPNIVLIGMSLYNRVGDMCQNITAQSTFISNDVNMQSFNISFGVNVFSNKIGVLSNDLVIGDESGNNEIGDICQNIQFGDYCVSNKIGHNADSISLNESISSVVFKDDCYNIEIPANSRQLTFGNNCYNIIFDAAPLTNDHFSDNCNGIDATTIPPLYGTDFTVYVNKASDTRCYASYFDGTNNVYTVIP